MPKILSEYDHGAAKRLIITMLQSPQGRQLGRYFLLERGKGAEGNLGQMVKEIQDIEREVIFELYASPAPVESRA